MTPPSFKTATLAALMFTGTVGTLGVAQAQGTASPAAQAAQPVNAQAVAAHYAVLVHANYQDTLNAARRMQAAVKAFTAKPSAETLAEARKTWLAAREFYGQTEAFRFYGGPIDDDKGPEGQLNAWPMDESYVDSVEGKPDSGLINDR